MKLSEAFEGPNSSLRKAFDEATMETRDEEVEQWKIEVRDWWYAIQDLLAEKDICLHERKRVEIEHIITQALQTAKMQEREWCKAEIENHGRIMATAYDGRVPFAFMETNEEKNRMACYLQAHKDIIQTITPITQ